MQFEGLSKDAVSSATNTIEIMAGYSSRTTASAIAFLWGNWEVLYGLYPGVFKARRIGPNSWRASGSGFGRGEWHLVKSSYGVNSGTFEFFSFGTFLGVTIRGMSLFEYRRLDAHTIHYQGRSWGEMPALLRPITGVIEMLAGRASLRVNRIGAAAVGAISKDPSLIQGHATTAQQAVLAGMLQEEEALIARHSANRKYFLAEHETVTRGGDGHLKPLHDGLQQLAVGNAKVSPHTIEVLEGPLSLFDSHPDMAVTKLRQILEPMVAQIYRREIGSSPHGVPLAKQIVALYQNSQSIPNLITSLMHTVVQVGNIGVHAPSIGKAASRIDLNAFITSFSAMLEIVKWYEPRYSEGRAS